MAKGFCIGLLPFFARHPTSCLHSANNGLPALVHGHVLHGDLLLAAGSVALKRLQLSRKGAGRAVEGPLGAVLLGNVLDVAEAAREGHGGHVDGRHLTRQHGLDLVSGLDPFEDGQHEVERTLVGDGSVSAGIRELREERPGEAVRDGTDRVHQEGAARFGVGVINLDGRGVAFLAHLDLRRRAAHAPALAPCLDRSLLPRLRLVRNGEGFVLRAHPFYLGAIFRHFYVTASLSRPRADYWKSYPLGEFTTAPSRI